MPKPICCHGSPVKVATNSSESPGLYSATVPVRAPSTVRRPFATVVVPPESQGVENQSAGRAGPLKSVSLALTDSDGYMISVTTRHTRHSPTTSVVQRFKLTRGSPGLRYCRVSIRNARAPRKACRSLSLGLGVRRRWRRLARQHTCSQGRFWREHYPGWLRHQSTSNGCDLDHLIGGGCGRGVWLVDVVSVDSPLLCGRILASSKVRCHPVFTYRLVRCKDVRHSGPTDNHPCARSQTCADHQLGTEEV